MTLVRHYAKRSKTLVPAERATMISVLGTLREAAQSGDPFPDCNSVSQKWDQHLETVRYDTNFSTARKKHQWQYPKTMIGFN
jgi:hypothetical protein